MSIELTMKRGEEAVAAIIDVRDDVTLAEAYDAASAGLHPMTVRAGAYLGRVLDNLKPVGEVSAPQQAPGPVIDWDSAPEGFPVWIEDVVPFGDSASCWAKDAGSYYLGVNGSKWNKPGDAIFCAHHRTEVITLTERDKADIDEYIRTGASALMGEAMAREVFPGAYVVKGTPSLSEELRQKIKAKVAPLAMLSEAAPVSQEAWDSLKPQQLDWTQAPQEATHALVKYDSTVWLKLGAGSDPAHRWSHSIGEWVSAYADSAQALGSEYIVARPAPAQKWSLHGKDGTWDYDTLAELVIDNYGHDSCGDGHPASYRPGLYEGDTIYRSIACFDDPVRFLPDASDVLDHMADATSDSDASEYADNYPDVDDAARAALEVALEPLQAWARKYCQPDFFTVKDITPYVLTVEDVRAAKAQERAQ